ncbi:MAG: hypothetical protein JXX14_02840 [Deltaproteobacteria bacterium]|nr:hypothetical protein [Deltaproteobacteria bacterium]
MTAIRQILFIAALPFEAASVRRHLDMAPSNGVLSAFTNPPYHLVVSGVGKAHAAAATGALCSQFDPDAIGAVVNIGVAGAVSDAIPIGSTWLINQIHDAATARSYYPDMLATHQLNETQVTTFDRPVSSTVNAPKGGLVDMEASAFFEAASMFVGPEKIICVKVVSDVLQHPPRISTKQMSAAIESAMPNILTVVHNSCACIAQNPAMSLNESHHEYMAGISKALRLTRTQQIQLHQAVTRFIHMHPSTPLPAFIPQQIKSSRERNHCFAELQQELLR